MSTDHSKKISREEHVNWITHAIGVLLSCVGLSLLLDKTKDHLIVVSIYGTTLLALYSISTLYHLFWAVKTKHVLRKLDHIGIFLLIGGTYTPFCLITLNETTGLIILLIVWMLALGGIVFKIFFTGKLEVVSLIIYVGLGWLCVAIIKPVYNSLSSWSFILLVFGGVLYTTGIIFYKMTRIRYHHAIWHLFVIAGSTAHFLSIFDFV